ncbi:gamma-glutamylcyclotransferase [Metabacillus indicus]|uniref:gamma-glutamylcyclotransferase n=1 Tax=Metabacillus indicus TaxID=246786 RepID=UPI0024939887|nr:gamma-glutamylcyclotransferase [Metabacillus indicus]
MKVSLFVYGTLRHGESNFTYMKEASCIAEQARTSGKLYDTGEGYPAMTAESGAVYGELYVLDKENLERIHELEGYFAENHQNNLFDLKEVTVMTDTGEFHALTYVMNESRTSGMKQIESGDWKEYLFASELPEETLYFAYGSCMDTERFKLAGVDHHFSEVIGAGKTERYSVKFTISVHDGGRADLVEEHGGAEGILYRVPKEAVEYLYVREGVGTGMYRPAFIGVKVNGREYKQCLTFTVIDKKEEFRPPGHYSSEILKGAEGRLSPEYVKRIKRYMDELPEM